MVSAILLIQIAEIDAAIVQAKDMQDLYVPRTPSTTPAKWSKSTPGTPPPTSTS